jgi:hypothetical protein
MAVTAPAPAFRQAWLGVVLAAALAGQAAGFHDMRQDDAFITYRYGQNLATGFGLVFNPGERLMASTAPGHALLAALAYPLTGLERLPTLMAVLGCVGWTAQVGAVFVLARQAVGGAAALLVALAIALGAAGSWEFVSLETHLTAALSVWALAAASRDGWLAAAWLVGFAVLMRPDAMLMALLLGAWGWTAAPHRLRPAALAFLAVTAPWVVFASAYFGTPLPQSAVAKFQRTAFWIYAGEMTNLPAWQLLPLPGGIAIRIVAWGLAAAGAVTLLRRAPRLWVLPVYALVHLGAYLYLRPTRFHHWHLYPATLVFVTLGLIALCGVLTAGSGRGTRGLAGAALLALLALYGASTTRFALAHERDYWFGARHTVYRAVAAFLRERAGPSDVVASLEVGTIAYYSGVRMHDWDGLVSRDPRRLPPELRWFVVDGAYVDRFPGFEPVMVWTRGGVAAHLFQVRRADDPRGDLPRAAPQP